MQRVGDICGDLTHTFHPMFVFFESDNELHGWRLVRGVSGGNEFVVVPAQCVVTGRFKDYTCGMGGNKEETQVAKVVDHCGRDSFLSLLFTRHSAWNYDVGCRKL